MSGVCSWTVQGCHWRLDLPDMRVSSADCSCVSASKKLATSARCLFVCVCDQINSGVMAVRNCLLAGLWPSRFCSRDHLRRTSSFHKSFYEDSLLTRSPPQGRQVRRGFREIKLHILSVRLDFTVRQYIREPVHLQSWIFRE